MPVGCVGDTRQGRGDGVSVLSYGQRKALRRFGRGQTIPGRMLGDPVIRECYDWMDFDIYLDGKNKQLVLKMTTDDEGNANNGKL